MKSKIATRIASGFTHLARLSILSTQIADEGQAASARKLDEVRAGLAEVLNEVLEDVYPHVEENETDDPLERCEKAHAQAHAKFASARYACAEAGAALQRVMVAMDEAEKEKATRRRTSPNVNYLNPSFIRLRSEKFTAEDLDRARKNALVSYASSLNGRPPRLAARDVFPWHKDEKLVDLLTQLKGELEQDVDDAASRAAAAIREEKCLKEACGLTVRWIKQIRDEKEGDDA